MQALCFYENNYCFFGALNSCFQDNKYFHLKLSAFLQRI